jgi:nucleoside-diphosphate-sugar epimerase
MKGVKYVLHVASPLGGDGDLVGPARDGTLRVLRAAVDAGVERVVMTSACAAATPPPGSTGEFDETLWTDSARKLDEYRKSKVLAERAAWEFMRGKDTSFVTVLPGAAGERFIAVSEFMWMADVARTLDVPAREVPNFLLRAVSLVNKELRPLVPMLGRRYTHSRAKAARVLGWEPRPARTTVVECAESLR